MLEPLLLRGAEGRGSGAGPPEEPPLQASSLELPISPYISLYLPVSSYTSLYLHASPCISQVAELLPAAVRCLKVGGLLPLSPYILPVSP